MTPPFPDCACSELRIFVEELRVNARLGIYPAEISHPQSVLVTMEVWLASVESRDDIEATIDYDRLCDIARQVLEHGHLNLVETAACEILARISRLPRVSAARVCCRKVHAVKDARAAGAEVFFRKGERP